MIERIKQSVNIFDLVNRLGLEINKAGFIKSVFKEEKTASLKLYRETNSFYCFATNNGGDVVDFYKAYCKVDTATAVKELSEMFGLASAPNGACASSKSFLSAKGGFALPKATKTPRGESGAVLRANKRKEIIASLLNSEREIFDERAGIYEFDGGLQRDEAEDLAYQYILNYRREVQRKIYNELYKFSNRNGINEQAFEYLTGNKRGLTPETVNKFKIFTISEAKKTVEFLKDTFDKDELTISGLFSNKYFIFWNHRIVIPYIEKGEIVYLRGRYFDERGKSKPERWGKYISLNNFSKTLSPKRFYNIDLLNSLNPNANLFICEGEFDAMVAMQYGNNAVGIAGVSNFPFNQIELLKPFTIYLALDNDEAGKRAAAELTEGLKRAGISLSILKLKKHKDITELLTEAEK